MLPTRFHARSRYCPQLLAKIDFIPARADHLTSTGCRQDREFEGTRTNAVLLSEIRHKGAELGIRQCGMVLDRPELGLSRQQIFEMAAPACRVVALAITARGRPIQDRLDPTAYSTRRLRLHEPD